MKKSKVAKRSKRKKSWKITNKEITDRLDYIQSQITIMENVVKRVNMALNLPRDAAIINEFLWNKLSKRVDALEVKINKIIGPDIGEK